MSFLDTVARAKTYLREHDRVSLRGLKREFDLDDNALEELIEELVDVQRVALREGVVLSWIGSPSPQASATVEAPEPAPEVQSERLASVGAERRQLTMMFCDLVGSTDLSQRLDAEDLRGVVRAYQETASSVIQRYEGHIAQYLGDGLLVYFGYPQAHEDDAERAVRAGLEIFTALKTLNESLEPEYDVRLAARVGIHTGPVVVGEMGGGAKTETLALGDTTNIAARLEGAAEPDSVLISDATLRLVAGMFVVEDRGPQMLKGVREPVALYRVVQPSGVRSRLDVAEGRLTLFVGREVELATLVDRWERAHDGEGQNVVVLGEAGVGKSRLVYQLHEHLKAVPHTWLECGATPYMEGTPFYPVIALVSQGLAFTSRDNAADKLAKLEVGLRALASAENVALMAEFLGLPPPTRLQSSPELRRRKTIELTLALFAEGLWRVGRHDDALDAIALGVAQAEQQEQHYYDANLHRLRAEILLDMDRDAVDEAEALLGKSLEIARRQEAKTFELRTATSLARLWQRQGKRDEAHALLQPIYSWFTEGFDTKDLMEAKALLEELA